MVELSEDEGMAVEEIAAVFAASESGVRRVLQRYRERGTHLALAHNGGRRPQAVGGLAEWLRSLVAARPDATRQEIKDALGLTVSVQTVGEWLVRLGLTLKKSRPTPPSRTGPTSPFAGPSGTTGSKKSIRGSWCSSTKRARKRA